MLAQLFEEVRIIEAKDTVMSDSEFPQLESCGMNIYPYLEKQADISFDAGYELGYENAILKDAEPWREGNIAGIKEVVDWLKSNRNTPLGKDNFGYYVWKKALQDKLKEWGIV